MDDAARLDDVDRRIIAELEADGRLSGPSPGRTDPDIPRRRVHLVEDLENRPRWSDLSP